MDSLTVLKSYCDSRGLDAGQLSDGRITLYVEGGLVAHLSQETRTAVGYKVRVATFGDGAGQRADTVRAGLRANMALIAERTGSLTLGADGDMVLAGAIDVADRNLEGFEDALEERLDEAERLAELIAAIT